MQSDYVPKQPVLLFNFLSYSFMKVWRKPHPLPSLPLPSPCLLPLETGWLLGCGQELPTWSNSLCPSQPPIYTGALPPLSPVILPGEILGFVSFHCDGFRVCIRITGHLVMETAGGEPSRGLHCVAPDQPGCRECSGQETFRRRSRKALTVMSVLKSSPDSRFKIWSMLLLR